MLAGLYKITVVPQVLPPTSNGRFVPVTFFGQVKGTRPAATGYFHVTDEYRRVEPSGDVTLTPAGKSLGFYVFDFRFTVDLQAKRSTNTPDGRHYDVLVGAADADNSDGKTVTVLVPKVYPPPKPHARVAKSAF